ncbi:tail fiber protein [Photorhabdus sp. RM323S]|uniref:tail fiber protein n=1 Tax=Photorhabdus sp. RM323S TaxID=3342828 RepID=UPI0036D90B35
MTNQDNSLNTKSKMKNFNDKPNGPSGGDLKNRFKEGSIPLQTDFADLIDIADIGRRAVGQAPDQTNGLNSTLELNDSGGLAVKIKANGGITVDESGVSIDPNKVLPRGMIVMFSGSSAPTGWAFCDGNTYNGIIVPDLRNRFIMCGENISETGQSSNKAYGNENEKNFPRNTTSTEVLVDVTVQDTTLTELQIPKHSHIDSLPYFETQGFAYGNTAIGSTNHQINNKADSSLWHPSAHGNDYHPHTSEVGGGKGHDHKATALSPPHTHSVDVVPPYYLLAFIMKL